ncbi:slipin family protein [Saccharophagus degradans]|uniref:Slipin family protein n=1 Tax=Saccharophagus degradans TaxID=86304 RepID=A0AAW7X6X5_9GAMM|nr:slipin family protein [Saccharophagus degradans]MDO6423347.1 slipin family protein [Saccharophagus degradans]MDO6606752.1 slipin family protein [Saccharophagus degradans]
MILWKVIELADNERALLYRKNKLISVLQPGTHRVATFKGALRVEKYDITKVVFEHPKAKFLLKQYADILAPSIKAVDIGEQEVGLVYRDNILVDVLAPASHLATWVGAEDVRVEIIDISENFRIDDKLVGLLGRGAKVGQSRALAQAIHYVEVPDEQVGLLKVNGKLEALLESGAYGFWKYNRSVAVSFLDLRLQTMDVSGQEILTKDRVSLRINLSATYRITDVKTVALKLKDYANFAYLELQLKLREAVGTKSLDELLADKDSLNVVIAQAVKTRFAEYGISLQSVGVKDIILPGDMKVILNKVVEAQKEAEANLIKRREETQAMRSLHNTAKLMENNPVLLRLRELESLEKVTDRIGSLTVFGGLESVMRDLVKLNVPSV